MSKLNKVLSLIILVLVVVSCGKDKEANFTLKGNVKGLKKGVVYLQKDGDSSIIDLDSMVINGEPNFSLQTNIDEPILLYLKLFKNDGEEHYIPFFADKGITEVNTTLKNFNFDAKIKGSSQQDLLNEFTDIMSRFNDENLNLMQANFLAQKENDSIALDSIIRKSNTLIKRKYSYTIQFAINNKDSEVAAYLALYEMPNANPIYIDSVYNNLTDKIKTSLYGKRLSEVVNKK
ncbi:DUF4369 domain-containing protein [Winogradskyella sp. UBA3174]|uniref:DUF4369 domain-containing protein n=1 Tax=Winogradskyella sp. UBA3174 TaxID=1947785 RepID=UPI0025DAA090|nr:DUF4369 domain-containing protein [Winogradskyella sp. UBA3174]|tara:strand:- start:8194 stop:8892 length:699 start_codon:yes stop_codon:yes gene_type:complete